MSAAFPAAPAPKVAPKPSLDTAWQVSQQDAEGTSRVWVLSQLHLPVWLRWFVAQAPDVMADRLQDQLKIKLQEAIPDLPADAIETETTRLAGHAALFFSVDNTAAGKAAATPGADAAQNVAMADMPHLAGYMVLVDGSLSFVMSGSTQPVDKNDPFLRSLLLPPAADMGDFDAQCNRLYKLAGIACLLALGLLIAAVIAVDKIIKRLRRRKALVRP